MSRRQNKNTFYTARKLIDEIKLFNAMKKERRLLKTVAVRIVTFIQNMSLEELDKLSVEDGNFLDRNLESIHKEAFAVSVFDSQKVDRQEVDTLAEIKSVKKEAANAAERANVAAADAAAAETKESKQSEDKRPIISVNGSNISAKTVNAAWQWKPEGEEFWMTIGQNTMIKDGVVRVTDPLTSLVSKKFDITREINIMVRKTRRKTFNLGRGEKKIKFDEAKEKIFAEMQVQTEIIPVDERGYSFETVKERMNKRIIGNPLLAYYVSQLFYDRVTQLIIEGRTFNNVGEVEDADVLRIFPTIMLQPDRMA